LGRASADEMESCFLPALDPKDVEQIPDPDGGPDLVYPFRWFVPLLIQFLTHGVCFISDLHYLGTACSIRTKDFGPKTGFSFNWLRAL
jgi:hypothetical protein